MSLCVLIGPEGHFGDTTYYFKRCVGKDAEQSAVVADGDKEGASAPDVEMVSGTNPGTKFDDAVEVVSM